MKRTLSGIISMSLGMLITDCHNYVQPRLTRSFDDATSLEAVRTRLLRIVEESGECEHAFYANAPMLPAPTRPEVPQAALYPNLLVCADADQRHGYTWAINVGTVKSIYIDERHFPPLLHWMWGDQVKITTTTGEHYSISFWDEDAKNVASTLQAYHNLKSQNLELNKPE